MNTVYLSSSSDSPNFIIDCYKLYQISNVIEYSCENFNSWKITYTNLDNQDNMNKQYYLIIDTTFSDSFGHWVYESAVYLPAFNLLKEIYPNIKLVLKEAKNYKCLFCKYFNISDDEIVYDIDPQNISFFPSPISCWNDKTITEEYKLQLLKFREYFINTMDNKYENLIMPRQIKENYKPNDRTYDFSKLIYFLKDNSFILNTDDIDNLQDQINIIQSSKNIFLSEGSPYFVNCLFCTNKNIYVVDAKYTVDQVKDYSKQAFMTQLHRLNNNILIISQDELLQNLKAQGSN